MAPDETQPTLPGVCATAVALYSSRPQSGKSTLAAALQDQGFVVDRFAGTLKRMLTVFFEDIGEDAETIERRLEGDLKDTPIPFLNNKTARDLMVSLGTEWGRNKVRTDLWTRIMERKVQRALSQGRSIVVDDMRFENEFALMKSMGAITVRIHRPDAPQPKVGWEGQLEGNAFDAAWHNDQPNYRERAAVMAKALAS